MRFYIRPDKPTESVVSDDVREQALVADPGLFVPPSDILWLRLARTS